METINKNGWTWIKNNKSEQIRSDIKGKYLFFSDNKEQLIDLAKHLLEKYTLLVAKTPSSDIPRKSKGFGFVLCLYDTENRHCNQLKNYETKGILFRYWKSDDATRAGKYSKHFTNNN